MKYQQYLKIAGTHLIGIKRKQFILAILLWFFVPINLIAYQIEPPLTKPLPAKFGTRTITPDWLLSLPKTQFNNPVIDWLDNSRLIYAFPPNDQGICKIVMIDVQTKKHAFLTEGCFPAPSPDGQWVALIRGKKRENNQLWIIRSDGTSTKQLSHVVKGLGINGFSYNFAWSPDSKQIALTQQPLIMPWEAKQKPPSKINVINIATGESKQIASVDGDVRHISWFPNGKELFFVKERVDIFYNQEKDEEWIQSIHVSDSHIHTLVKFDGLQQSLQPAVSCNGQQIAFMYDADNPIYDYMPSIGLISTNLSSNTTSTITRLTHEMKLYSPQWSQNNKHIYALRDYGAYKQIYSVNAKTGEPKKITNAPLNIESYALSPNGTQLAWIGQDAHGARVIRVANSDGGAGAHI